MRHLLGALIGLLGAPLVLLLWAVGIVRVQRGYVLLKFDFGTAGVGLLLILLSGLVLGLIVAARRVSFLATLIAAVPMLAAVVVELATPGELFALVPGSGPVNRGLLTVLSTGGEALIAGLLLIVTIIPVAHRTRAAPPPPY